MIPEQYRFDNLTEFYTKRKIVYKWYATIDIDKQFNYKYYVFARPRRKDMPEDYCDMIWDWLNDNTTDEEFELYYNVGRYFDDQCND